MTDNAIINLAMVRNVATRLGELVDEIAQGPENLRIHLTETFRKLLRNERFLEALPGHLASDTASQQRLPILETRLNKIAEMV